MKQKILEIDIQDFSSRGFGLAPSEKPNTQIEVAHAIVGDRVRVDVKRQKQKVQKGKLLELLTASNDRVDPPCSHATLCGGCCWQAMRYEAQLRHKQERILRSFGPLISDHTVVLPMIACDEPWSYRNKMEFTFSENRAGTKYLGLMIAHAEPYVFHLKQCLIAPPWMSEVLASVRSWWNNSSLSAYDPPNNTGTLRYLTLREGVRTQDRMAILNVSGNPDYAPSQMDLETLKKALGTSISQFIRIHQTKKGVPTQFYEMHLSGKDHIEEVLHLDGEDLRFKISPASFFQPNTIQAEKLYQVALDLLGTGLESVYDLYCGTGTLGMAASRRAKKVIGIELNPHAVLDAKANAERNQLANIQFIQGDAGNILSTLSSPSAVMVDPPRAGLQEFAIDQLKKLSPEKILYVSCNPATQASDIKQLSTCGYVLQTMQAIDQFPHTAHVENIAMLVKKACS